MRLVLRPVSLVVISFGLSLIFGLANTIVQERAPASLRGRVSAVMGLSFFGLMPIAGLGVTSLADLDRDAHRAGSVGAFVFGVGGAFRF